MLLGDTSVTITPNQWGIQLFNHIWENVLFSPKSLGDIPWTRTVQMPKDVENDFHVCHLQVRRNKMAKMPKLCKTEDHVELQDFAK